MTSRKYRNKPSHGYRSQLERHYAAHLDIMMHAVDPKERVAEWEYESERCAHRIVVNGVDICGYMLDFWVRYADGREEFVEIKGFGTEAWRLKWKLVRACFPENQYRLIKKGML